MMRRTKKWSRVRTDEFTIPLIQTGWGWGYGKTRWYRPSDHLRNLMN